MGQAGSAQREPSMEEILASIRKIIEETDGAQDAEEAAAPEGAASTGVGTGEQISPARDETEVSAFRDAIQSDPLEAPSMTLQARVERQEPESPPFSLSDVQRRLVRERDEKATAATPAVEELAADEEQTSSVNFDIPDDAKPEEDVLMQLAERRAATAEKAPPVNSNAEAARTQRPQADEAKVAQKGPEDRPAIISAAAGRQVAGSFEELKEAFMASRQRSFDEMAEEMMRPMLQDWLDNNLPLLVERLVREEIERIARGG